MEVSVESCPSGKLSRATFRLQISRFVSIGFNVHSTHYQRKFHTTFFLKSRMSMKMQALFVRSDPKRYHFHQERGLELFVVPSGDACSSLICDTTFTRSKQIVTNLKSTSRDFTKISP